MLTTATVALRLGVEPMTVRRWCQRGLLPGAEKSGVEPRTTWLIPESALEGFTPPKRGPRKRE